MFGRARQNTRSNSNQAVEDRQVPPSSSRGTGSDATSSLTSETPTAIAVSPLGIDFDFELPPTPHLRSSNELPTTAGAGSFSRPWTSDGLNSAKHSPISMNPPILPPIPRVASRYEKDRNKDRTMLSDESKKPSLGETQPIVEMPDIADGESTLKPRLSFDHPVDLLSLAPGTRGVGNAGMTIPSPTDSTPKMESSLFPPKSEQAVTQSPTATPTSRVMTRSFIDSRDKPYNQPGSKQFARAGNHSTPDLLASVSTVDPTARPATSRLNPQKSSQSLAGLSGTTARPSTQASLVNHNATSTPIITIGTPYSETSASFPVPERVTKRPKGSASTATVAGVAVPTHYSSSSAVKSGDGKKKGRLLNPMSVFQRRRTGQDTDNAVEERAQRQALARQKDVVAGGVKNIPADFDPSIKGKVVHDFSAPRISRNTFGEFDPNIVSQLNTSLGTPSTPSDGFSPRSSSLPTNQSSRENSSRLSARTPIFKEHLNEEADASGRVSSIHAENLENKDFLQRASMHSPSNFSQDSAVLPPFARRSQILDPAQAAFFQDTDSKRSSGKSAEKTQDVISPVTSPYERSVFMESNRSISPISPSNSKRTLGQPSPDFFGSLPHEDAASRPISADLAPPRNEFAAESPGKKSPMAVSPIEPLTPTNLPQQDSTRTSPLQLTPPSHRGDLTTSEVISHDLNSAKKLNLDPTTGFPTPDRTPEPASKYTTPTGRTPSQPKSSEKRASAASRSKRAFSGPKHHASTASRFSFQYASGESAAEEHALEDKHRKLADRGKLPGNARGQTPDEDDEDYFDEDAIDDMDEMEMEDNQFQHQFPPVPTMPSSIPASIMQPMPQTPDFRDQGLGDDEIDVDGADELDLPYPEHPAYRLHSAIISPHTSFRPGTPDGYWRGSTIDHYMRDSVVPQRPRTTSSASALTINTNVGPFGNSSKPNSATSQALSSHRDNRSGVVSGMSFSSASDVTRSPPARGSPGQWPARTGAYTGAPSGLSMQIGTPESSNRNSSTNSDSYRAGDGPGSARSMGSSALSQVTQSSPAKFGSPASSSRSVPAETPLSGTKQSLITTRASDTAAVSGLGLDNVSAFGYDDSPTIPLRNAPNAAPHLGHKSNLSASMVPIAQGSPSPPATARLADNETFKSDFSPKPPGPVSVSGFRWSQGQPQGANSDAMVAQDVSASEKNVSGFGGFDFDGSPNRTRNSGSNPPLRIATTALDTQSSPSISNLSPGGSSALYQGRLGRGLQVRSQQSSRRMHPIPMDNSNDDMYYDDGNFDAGDMDETYGDSINEDAFDDDSFLAGNSQHRRYNSEITVKSMGSEGPYPVFAMPNAAKARQHDSQLLLEDLPLQGTVEPHLIPKRNPSEDAKRFGLKKEAPPVPIVASNTEASSDSNMQRYHAALADAANKAAADGRFLRASSVSTARTYSGSSSRYDGSGIAHDKGDDFANDSVLFTPRNGTLSTQFTQQPSGPPDMNFDFGFDQAPTDDESYMNEDDLVAAANAEALAFDDEGFYGQEFHFYGRPRSDSGEVEAVHGGYFGEDGDDGLTRNRSLKEPNLTPITERSEFSTRNSFIGLGQLHGTGAASGANPFGVPSPALARVPITPWGENDITSFDQLRKLRANAFGGSQTSLDSSKRSSAHSIPGGIASGTRPNPISVQQASGSEGTFAYSGFHDSPSEMTDMHDSSLLATPKRASHGNNPLGLPDTPPTARRISAQSPGSVSHSRNGSSTSNGAGVADSVTYVREDDPAGNGKSRWVLERRRTSSQGQLELVGRELVQGGWI